MKAVNNIKLEERLTLDFSLSEVEHLHEILYKGKTKGTTAESNATQIFRGKLESSIKLFFEECNQAKKVLDNLNAKPDKEETANDSV